MDGPFFPAPHPDNDVAPGSAEVLHLRRALFVVKGQYFNPLTKKDEPLPPHRWVLFESESGRFSESATSTADGITGIFEPNTSLIAADAKWELMMIPVIPGKADAVRYAAIGQVYLDIKNNTWVDSPDFRRATGFNFVPEPTIANVPMMLYPLWSTARHAERGCGFRAPLPPSGSEFAETGFLKTSELKPHGTVSKPWVLQLDEDYLRLFVQLRFYDFVQKLERPIGRGIILQSNDKLGFGASSVMLPGGTFFVMHPSATLDPETFRYEFRLPKNARMPLKTNVIEADTTELGIENIETHYLLPQRWRSSGHEAWEGIQDASAAIRKPFPATFASGHSEARALCFHLDDVVIAKDHENTLDPVSDRAAIFDSMLRLKKPASNAVGPLPFSTQKLQGKYLRAEEWFFERGKGLEHRTRVIEHEGEVLDIAEERYVGFQKLRDFEGCRAAMPLRRESLDLSLVGLVDSRYLDFTYDGKKGKLAHLLVWNSALITYVGDPGDNENVEERTETLMSACAKVWTGEHPAFPSKGDEIQKDYAIVARSGLAAGGTIIKPRFHFAIRKSKTALRVPLPTRISRPANSEIHVFMAEGRASGGDPMELYLKFNLVDHEPDGDPPVVDVLEYEFRGRTVRDRFEEYPGRESTLAHELGHWMDLPDEYLEPIRHGDDDLDGKVFRFSQTQEVKPLFLDDSAMMQGSQNPRLRYIDEFYQRVFDSSQNPPWHTTDGPFIPIYAGERETLRFIIPRQHARFNGRPRCWHNPLRFPMTRGRGFLFPMGTDESNKGPLFTPPGSGFLPRAFDGVAVFQTKIWFDFADDVGSLESKWDVMHEWAKQWFDRATHPRFLVNWDGEDSFRRVGIVLQPLFEFGPIPSEAGTPPVKETDRNADILVHIHDGDPGQQKPGSVRIDEDDLNHDLMRFALNDTIATATLQGAPLGIGDLFHFHAALSTALGRSMGTIEAF